MYDGSTGWVWGKQNPSTLSEWQETTGQDANSKTGKPVFVNAGGGDLHLQAGHQHAGDSGVDISDITKVDFDGHPRSADHPVAGADVPAR